MGREVSPGLLAGARAALATNRWYGLTVPNIDMFRAGYLWDTAVIAKGLAVHDPELAAADILRNLQAQWGSGMLPNEAYFEDLPLRRFLYGRHPGCPDGLTTSGITQPPMIVRSALEVGRRLDPDRRSAFYTSVLPPLKRLCRWILDERRGRHGLAVVIHPYETGMDNRFDLAEAMGEEWAAGEGPVATSARDASLLALATARRLWGDCRRVPPGHRSSHQDMLAAYLQTRHLRRLGYDLAAVEASGRGLLVEDVGYNAVLVDAFACLQEIADALPRREDPRLTVEAELKAEMDRVGERLEDLWFDDPTGRSTGYHSRNYRTGKPLLRPNVAGLFPLLVSGVGPRVETLVRTLVDPAKYWTRVAPPSAPVDSDGFEPDRYWRGAAWSFPTDIIETALELRGRHDIATELRRRYLARPHAEQHAEYENPLTGRPLGARPFSPAAALAIRLADRQRRP